MKNKFNYIEVTVLMLLSILISLIFGKMFFSNSNDTYIKKFEDNYSYIVDNYYSDIDKDKLIDGAIEGMIKSLDDVYSAYMNKSEATTFNRELEGCYEGIGITITQTDEGKILIVDVLENSPASKTNIKINDEIIKINEVEIGEINIENISKIVAENEEIEFAIKGDNEYNVILKKDKIILSSVDSQLIEYNNKRIGYIYVNIFAYNTHEQFKKAIDDLENKKMDGLVIDFRNNTGGHLSSLKEMLSYMLDSKKIMYQMETKGKKVKTYSSGKVSKEYPIAILTNYATASAAEVMTISLKENLNSVVIVGNKTYGKGLVQDMNELDNGNQYKISTKTWLSPKGNSINKVGITPDIVIQDTQYFYITNDYNKDEVLKAALNTFK